MYKALGGDILPYCADLLVHSPSSQINHVLFYIFLLISTVNERIKEYCSVLFTYKTLFNIVKIKHYASVVMIHNHLFSYLYRLHNLEVVK